MPDRRGDTNLMYLGIIILVLGMVAIGWTASERYYGSSFQRDVKDVRVDTLSRILMENFVSFYKGSVYVSVSRAIDEAGEYGGIIPSNPSGSNAPPISWVCEVLTIPTIDEIDASISDRALELLKEMVSRYKVPGTFASDQVSVPGELKLSKRVRQGELNGDPYPEYWKGETDEIEYYVSIQEGDVKAVFGAKTTGNTTLEPVRFWLLYRLISAWLNNNIGVLNDDACYCNAQCGGSCACMDKKMTERAKELQDFIQAQTGDPWIVCRARELQCVDSGMQCEEPGSNTCVTWTTPPIYNVECGTRSGSASMSLSSSKYSYQVSSTSFKAASGTDEGGGENTEEEEKESCEDSDGDGFPDFAPKIEGMCRRNKPTDDCNCRVCYYIGHMSAYYYEIDCMDTGYYVESENGPKPLSFNFRILLSKQQELACEDHCVDDCPDTSSQSSQSSQPTSSPSTPPAPAPPPPPPPPPM